MALLIVAPTSGQVEGITRNALFKRFLRETGLGTYGTATGGSSSTLDDTTRLKSTQLSANDWQGGWLRVGKDAGGAGAAPENEHQPITAYDPTTNGRITFNPTVTAGIASGDEYQLWRYPNPTFVKDFLDQVLTNDVYLPYWSPLSELPDFDMEANNTTDWVGSSATVTKSTAEPALNGKRWLSVATTGGNGYARTATFYVEPNKRYHISALVRSSAASTTASLIAYDVTNSAAIDNKTSTRQYPTRLWFEFTAPATCNQMQIRLSNVQTSVTSYWDDVILYALDSPEISLPNWVKNKAQIKGIFQLQASSLDSNAYDGTLQGDIVNSQYNILDNSFGRGQLRLVASNGAINGPLYIFGIRNEEAYVDDNSDIKRVDANLLFYALASKVFDHLKQLPTSGPLDNGWVTRQAAEYGKLYKQALREQSERVEAVIQSVQPDGAYLDGRFVYGGV